MTSSLAPVKCALFLLHWMVKRERERARKKSASSLKEILCNREQITVLPGRDWNGGGWCHAPNMTSPSLAFLCWVLEKGEMRFNLARTVCLVRWYTGMIKCEGIKLQTAAFIGTRYPSHQQLSSQLRTLRRSGEDGKEGGFDPQILFASRCRMRLEVARCFKDNLLLLI